MIPITIPKMIIPISEALSKLEVNPSRTLSKVELILIYSPVNKIANRLKKLLANHKKELV